jgi:hypothetical protein
MAARPGGGGGGGYAYGGFVGLCASAVCAARHRRSERRADEAAAAAIGLGADKRRQHAVLRALQILSWGLAALPVAVSIDGDGSRAARCSAAVLSIDLVEMVARAAAAIPLPSPRWQPVQASSLQRQDGSVVVNEAWQTERKSIRPQQQQQQQQRAYAPAEERLLERFSAEQQLCGR